MRGLVFTAMTLKIPIFLDVTLCCVAGSFWCPKGLYHLQKCALLLYYVASSGNFLPTFRKLSVPLQGGGIHKGVTMYKTFYNLLFKYKAVATPAHWDSFSYLIRWWGFYCIRIIICISIKAICNGMLRDLACLFKIPIGTWRNFFEIYQQLGHVPSKGFASPLYKYGS
jgi:hypothetical protein